MPYRPPAPDEVRCQASVRDLGRWPSYHRCERKGVVEREGAWYCKQHDPIAIETKRAARFAKWDTKIAEDGVRRESEAYKLATWDMLLEALNKVYDTTHDPAIELIAADAIDKARETR